MPYYTLEIPFHTMEGPPYTLEVPSYTMEGHLIPRKYALYILEGATLYTRITIPHLGGVILNPRNTVLHVYIWRGHLLATSIIPYPGGPSCTLDVPSCILVEPSYTLEVPFLYHEGASNTLRLLSHTPEGHLIPWKYPSFILEGHPIH